MKKESVNVGWLVNIILLMVCVMACEQSSDGKHLFILSGQSNMARLDPQDSFNPHLVKQFGDQNILTVKSAFGGQPIKRWYKDWHPVGEQDYDNHADLYDSLLMEVKPALVNQTIKSVTFIWMQGERDAREEWGREYKQSLEGLYQQLTHDLNRQDVNFIIGRLSDFDLTNAKYPHWTMVRQAQMTLADSNPRFSWVNTDDLNDGFNQSGKAIQNDLHMSEKGYEIMGQRFAEEAIRLIQLQN